MTTESEQSPRRRAAAAHVADTRWVAPWSVTHAHARKISTGSRRRRTASASQPDKAASGTDDRPPVWRPSTDESQRSTLGATGSHLVQFEHTHITLTEVKASQRRRKTVMSPKPTHRRRAARRLCAALKLTRRCDEAVRKPIHTQIAQEAAADQAHNKE